MLPPDASTRLLLGVILAALVVAPALRAGALSRSGGAAALVAGVVATAAGWEWAILLVAYFVTTTALTRAGRRAKQARTGDVVAKGGARDWTQVAANGGVFVAAAGWAVLSNPPAAAVMALGAGSLAAAAADSWATEIGTLAARPPRSILTLRPVPAGTSGGISLPGTIALVAGAGFVAALALLVGFPASVARAALAGGVFGAVADSVLGATLQSRRWCPGCSRATEQAVHRCGGATIARGGIEWLDNDAVNFACTVAGGLLAAAIAG